MPKSHLPIDIYVTGKQHVGDVDTFKYDMYRQGAVSLTEFLTVDEKGVTAIARSAENGEPSLCVPPQKIFGKHAAFPTEFYWWIEQSLARCYVWRRSRIILASPAERSIHRPSRSWLMRILVLTGAGVSAESGIPTFRGKDGYWRNLDPTKLATPEAFARNPNLVWDWYRERRQRIRSAQPNAAHVAVVKLAQNSREFLLVTQNVDDLHARAEWNGNRLPPNKIVQIHGDIFVTRCSRCDFSRDECPPSVAAATSGAADEQEGVPQCPRCSALMRPAVVWFGEYLDAAKIDAVENFLSGGPCDLVIVIGTTALFGYIIDWSVRARGGTGQLIEVNLDETSLSQFATQLLREPAATAVPRLVDQFVAQPMKL